MKEYFLCSIPLLSINYPCTFSGWHWLERISFCLQARCDPGDSSAFACCHNIMLATSHVVQLFLAPWTSLPATNTAISIRRLESSPSNSLSGPSSIESTQSLEISIYQQPWSTKVRVVPSHLMITLVMCLAGDHFRRAANPRKSACINANPRQLKTGVD